MPELVTFRLGENVHVLREREREGDLCVSVCERGDGYKRSDEMNVFTAVSLLFFN